MWCITLIDLQILKNSCNPGIKPTWSWCMIFLICCWIPFARISNKSFLKEINPEYSLERLMLNWNSNTLATWWQRADSLKKTLMLVKTEGKRRRGWQRMRWFDSITSSMDRNLGRFQEMVRAREAWYTAVHGVAKSGTGLGDWTTATKLGAWSLCLWVFLSLKWK